MNNDGVGLASTVKGNGVLGDDAGGGGNDRTIFSLPTALQGQSVTLSLVMCCN